jgi:hypothetical protein
MAQAAGIGKIVTCMTLRHSYAVDCLRHGMTEVQLQRNLGHKSIETTLLYQRCSLPADAKSPLDIHTNSQVPPSTLPNAQTPTHSPLLPKLDIRDLTLPFPELTSGAREFVSMLKTRIKGRFLALRSFLSNTS